ncbi:hypothetical protein, partial [Vibrio furnissii]|uniref:hypothetical protein n=1 Tax=Vibrio furnissii TaxID=29494 RepID=UPI001EECA810
VQVTVAARSSRSGTSNPGSVYATAYGRLTGTFGTVQSALVDAGVSYHSSGNGGTTSVSETQLITFMVTVPANWTGSMWAQVLLATGSGSSEATMSGSCGTQWVGRLFRNGSGLS